MAFERLLNQARVPVFTVISLLTTIIVEVMILLAAASLPNAGFGAIGIVLITGLIVVVGLIVNSAAGCLAHKYREVWGGRIAAFGTAAWVTTILVIRSFWR